MPRILTLSFLSLSLAALLSLASVTEARAARCYNISQFEAEQGLRIHSELMVISLTCQRIPGHAGLYDKYQQFTQKNRILLADYENRLISYYKSNGSAAPSKQLHTLRTDLANEISQHAVSMSVTSFCSHFSSRIDRALSMDRDTLQRWARQVWPDQKTTAPLCRQDEETLRAAALQRQNPQRTTIRR